jgi:hypothetical protein|tara:strand:+ start:371 stop:871 length:501 start_codon:yes stop_codon:yes gene_type:complete
MTKFIKFIQDSDLATGILLLIIASISYAGVDEGIWEGYGYIDWVFPIMSSFLLFFISAVYLFVGSLKIMKGNTNNDLKIDKSEIPSIINVVVYSILLFVYLVLLYVFGFWFASILLLWSGIAYFKGEKNIASISKSLGIALLTCLIAYVVFTYIFWVPFPESRVFM